MEASAQHLPVRIEFVESAARVDEILPTLYEMVADGLIEVQDTTVIRAGARREPSEPRAPHRRVEGPAKLMRVFLGEADRWHDGPLYEAIVKKLRMMDISGATVYRGILGYGAKGHEHKKSFLHVSRDLPIMLSVIDEPGKIAAAAREVEAMLEDGLIVISDAGMIRLLRGLEPSEAPDAEGPNR
jgi:PII-like signaling protein